MSRRRPFHNETDGRAKETPTMSSNEEKASNAVSPGASRVLIWCMVLVLMVNSVALMGLLATQYGTPTAAVSSPGNFACDPDKGVFRSYAGYLHSVSRKIHLLESDSSSSRSDHDQLSIEKSEAINLDRDIAKYKTALELAAPFSVLERIDRVEERLQGAKRSYREVELDLRDLVSTIRETHNCPK